MPWSGAGLAQGLPPAKRRVVPSKADAVTRRHDGGVRNESAQPFEAGDVLELTVGEAVHGGWCIARPGRPQLVSGVPCLSCSYGMRCLVNWSKRLSRRRRRGSRARTRPRSSARSPERVSAPCPYARPGGCGGCDWQHASVPAQRTIKAQVISQQLRRIAGLEREVIVEPLPGDDAGLGWRTRVRFAVGADGRAGLYRHRSHEITPVSDCLIAHPLITAAGVTRSTWPGARWVEAAASPATGDHALLVRGTGRGPSPAIRASAGDTAESGERIPGGLVRPGS